LRDGTGLPNLLKLIPYIGGLTGLAIVTVVPILSFDTVERMMIPPLVYAACHVLEGPFLTTIFLGEDSS
jgi:predicted PurR-regulated permease PerM